MINIHNEAHEEYKKQSFSHKFTQMNADRFSQKSIQRSQRKRRMPTILLFIIIPLCSLW